MAQKLRVTHDKDGLYYQNEEGRPYSLTRKAWYRLLRALSPDQRRAFYEKVVGKGIATFQSEKLKDATKNYDGQSVHRHDLPMGLGKVIERKRDPKEVKSVAIEDYEDVWKVLEDVASRFGFQMADRYGRLDQSLIVENIEGEHVDTLLYLPDDLQERKELVAEWTDHYRSFSAEATR